MIPAPPVPDRPTYKVRARKGDRWWVIEVPEVDGVFTRARVRWRIEYMARDATALMLDVPKDSFDLDVEIQPRRARRSA